MSGEWIKVEISLPSKPEVIRIGRALGLSPDAVCGVLIRFWGWASANSVDGVVDGVETRDVDMVLSLPGFGDALHLVGWLQFDADKKRLTIPNFDRHNGESAKKRALKNGRQARWRASNVDAVVDAGVDTPETKERLPEKRREEIKESAVALPDWFPPEWHEFEKHRREKKATLTPTAKRGCIKKLILWQAKGHDIVGILRNSIDNGYTGIFEPDRITRPLRHDEPAL